MRCPEHRTDCDGEKPPCVSSLDIHLLGGSRGDVLDDPKNVTHEGLILTPDHLHRKSSGEGELAEDLLPLLGRLDLGVDRGELVSAGPLGQPGGAKSPPRP